MKDKTPLSIKLEEGVADRLEFCARETKLKKYQLAIMAIEAAVEAIERNNYKLVVPIEFKVQQIPGRANYPEHTSQHVSMNEPSSDQKKDKTGKGHTEIVHKEGTSAAKSGYKKSKP